MRAIHQFVAGFSAYDAISSEAIALKRIFNSWGASSEIFSEPRRILPELRHVVRDAAEYAAAPNPDDLAILHLSIGSTVNELFARLPCKKAIIYHNITPPAFFETVNRETARNLASGIRQAQALAGVALVNLADSKYNADELARLGYAHPKVFELVLNLEYLRTPPNRSTLRRLIDGRINVLFVGRCAPNKKIEDTLAAFYCFHKFVQPKSRLICAGSFVGVERYYHLLLLRIRELGLQSDVWWPGPVSQADLNAMYSSSHVFLSMSEHEGFCAPLLESMFHGLPVMAYAAGGVLEAMDGAGILIRRKQYEAIAEMMGKVARPGTFRTAVLDGQRQRVQRYLSRDPSAELRALLTPLVSL